MRTKVLLLIEEIKFYIQLSTKISPSNKAMIRLQLENQSQTFSNFNTLLYRHFQSFF